MHVGCVCASFEICRALGGLTAQVDNEALAFALNSVMQGKLVARPLETNLEKVLDPKDLDTVMKSQHKVELCVCTCVCLCVCRVHVCIFLCCLKAC